MKKAIIMYNEKSGLGNFKNYHNQIKRIFNEQDIKVTFVPFLYYYKSKLIQAKDIITKHDDADIVISAGGDGSFSNLAAGIKEIKRYELPISHLPAGTINDIAYSYGLSGNILETAKNIASGSIHKIDLLTINEVPCLYVAAFGMFSNIPYITPVVLKKILGKFAYYLASGVNLPIQIFQNYNINYEIDGIEHKDNYCLGTISNSSGFAGFKNIYPDFKLDDGKFECTLIKNPLELAKLATSLTIGNKKLKDLTEIETFQTDNLVIRTKKDLSLCLDGEKGPKMDNKLVFKMNEQQINVVLPDTYDTDLKLVNAYNKKSLL